MHGYPTTGEAEINASVKLGKTPPYIGPTLWGQGVIYAKFWRDNYRHQSETWYHQGYWPLLCSGPAVSLRRERRGFLNFSMPNTLHERHLYHRKLFAPE